MKQKAKASGSRRNVMAGRTRVVAYFDEAEKARVEQAAKARRMSVSSYVASAALRATESLSASVPSRGRFQSLRAMRGFAKETFEALGGGEEFLRRERAEFNEAMNKREAAIERESQAKR
ncbi:MAG: hypothetical protein ABIP81_03960 [Terriglobales bacterium]